MKNDLKNTKQNEPDWLWWKTFSALFGGTADLNTTDVSVTSRKSSLPSTPVRLEEETNGGGKSSDRIVIHRLNSDLEARVIVSPIKYNDYVTKENYQSTPTVIRSRRRTMVVPSKLNESIATDDVPPPIISKITSRRRTVAPKARVNQQQQPVDVLINESPSNDESAQMESPVLSNKRRRVNTKSPIEPAVSPIQKTSPKQKAAAKTDSARKRGANSKNVSLVEESTTPVSKLIASKSKVILQTTPVTQTSIRGRKGKTDGNDVEQMDTAEGADNLAVSNSSTLITGDECTSTAMFVECRLRASNGFKRQRLIYKIHELFYQEEVEELSNTSRQ